MLDLPIRMDYPDRSATTRFADPAWADFDVRDDRQARTNMSG